MPGAITYTSDHADDAGVERCLEKEILVVHFTDHHDTQHPRRHEHQGGRQERPRHHTGRNLKRSTSKKY